jgi:hypothetical protein
MRPMCTPRGSLSTVQAKYVQALDSEREGVHLIYQNTTNGSRGGIHERFFSALSRLSKLRVDSSGIHRQFAQTPWFFLYSDSH